MLLSSFVDASNATTESAGRLDKIARLASLLGALAPAEIPIAVAFLTGTLRQGRIGLTGAAIRQAADTPPADEPTLTLAATDQGFLAIAGLRGVGSGVARVQVLRTLFAAATAVERAFLVRLLHGELRQGADEGLLLDAVARAAGIPGDQVRRAVMISGSVAAVAEAALTHGEPALRAMAIALFTPVQPMLAGAAEDVASALEHLGPALLEFKLDGARIQVHKRGDDVRVYSRSLRDVTAAVPEVVETVRAIDARELILDGEALALRAGGQPHPFQVTMRRFGRKQDDEATRTALPLSPFFFDCLYVDGAPLIDDPLARRVAVLDAVVPDACRVPCLVAGTDAETLAFADRAADAGHEGVMAKSLEAPYAAGRRGAAWLKVKPAHTLDLVVLAAEWGSGRRAGTLSNLHLGARDTERGGFVMLGKTFKGLTDALLAWQTRELLAREIGRERHVVFVRPELVVEVAFNEIQESPHYPGRLTLRFARVRRYREDKPPSEADTLRTIQDLYARITGLEPPVR